MSEEVETLVEERVAQLREIHRRRSDLLVEMFYLMKRKEDLSNMTVLEEDNAELGEFMENMDIMKRPDVSHVAPLLKLIEGASPLASPSPASEKAVSANGSPHAPSSGSPMSEPPVLPTIEQADSEEPVVDETTHPQDADETMEVDAPETQEIQEVASSTQESTLDSIAAVAAEVLTDFEDPQQPTELSQTEDQAMEVERTPSPQPQEEKQKSPTPPPPEHPTTIETPSIEVPEQPPAVALPEELSHAEDAADGAFAGIQRTTPRVEAPLPIARIESQTRYLVSEAPSPAPPPPDYTFDVEMSSSETPEEPKTIAPSMTLLKVKDYTVPPLKKLPIEYNRKGKPRPLKKRDKEKSDGKQEWQPMGLAKWNAVLRTNPVYKKVAKASKCLSTKDWNIALTELKLIRTFDRIDALKDAGRWSFRQPKKQRGVGGLVKSHWDHLMDEMKWMRTDFREERKWKLAVAYGLAHAVVEWHKAGNVEERLRRGICVRWSPDDRRDSEDIQAEQQDYSTQDAELDGLQADSKGDSTPANDDNSDDDSEDEQEKERQAVLNALDPSTALQEALEDAENAVAAAQDVQPKTEEVEDTTALHLNTLAERPIVNDVSEPLPVTTHETQTASALKPGAGDTMLSEASASVPAASSSVTKTKSKTASYAHLREQIIYSDIDKLFLDLDDFELAKSMSGLTTDEGTHHAPPLPTDISAIFPDLQPYGLLEVPPVSTTTDGKKKDRRGERDDPTKRADDMTYTKVVPLSKFMLQKTTLLGPLEPAKKWHDGEWHDLDETTVTVDFDTPASRPIDDSMSSWLFEGNKPKLSPASLPLPLPIGSGPRRRAHEMFMDPRFTPGASGSRAKATESTWTPEEDALLKRFVEKYPYNWVLIAEAFNLAKVTIPLERRSPVECYERWKAKFGPNAPAEEEHRPPPTPTTSMTTRGTKRSLSTSVNASSGTGSAFESKKKRRHTIMHEAIRKVVKKREQAQRANAANQQRKASALNNMHDTHGQYSRLPKKTPAELSRQKADADAAHNQQMMIERRRHEELRNQQRMQELAQRQQAMQAAQNGQMRMPNALPAGQSVPQIRTQVNISGQQPRLQNQLALNSTRIANSSVLQQQARALQAAQAQQQGHPGVSQSLAAGAAPALNAHLSPPFNTQRTASTSPGLGQQSPPPAAAQSTATSPRPPSAQAQAQAQAQAHMNTAQQAQAPIAQQRPFNPAALASYYASMGAAHGTSQFTQEQLAQAHVRMILQQQALQQQQQAQQQAAQAQQQQQQQNGGFQ